MTRPATGTTFNAGGYNDVDNRFQSNRTGLLAVLIRDARGAATDISPHNSDGSVRWSPFASDGQLRSDLFAFVRQNGVWVANTSTNEGFHLGGAFAEGNGPSQKPSIDSDEQMIEQSNAPFDVVMVKDDEPFSFTCVETAKPFLRRLRNNLRLTDESGNNLVEVPGGADAGWSKPLDSDTVDRQVLLVSARQRGGKVLYEVDGYAATKLTDIGASRKGKKGEAAELTMKPIPDGYFMGYVDGEYVPIIKHTWVSGTAWADLGTPVPTVYTVTLGSPSAGTFTLTLAGRTTATIAYNAAASAVKSALVALDDGYTTADFTVTGSAGGPYTVTVPAGGSLTGTASLTGGTFSVAAA
jgi:hypothetical protein